MIDSYRSFRRIEADIIEKEASEPMVEESLFDSYEECCCQQKGASQSDVIIKVHYSQAQYKQRISEILVALLELYQSIQKDGTRC